tara:strand:+ start:1197 stop:2459 length:1263 start_codon:yes stop_codon:yes gene_type:complete
MGSPVQPVLAMDLPGIDPSLFALVGEEAAAMGIARVALVGGGVRDGLLHLLDGVPWRGCRDLDFLVEGDAVALAEALFLRVGPERITRLQIHRSYGTAELELDGLLVDFASARLESYPSPGANPVVTSGDLESDLERRDFSVNAMAIVLGVSSLEEGLVDPHAGLQDLEARELSFLHRTSVADDPTRVVRAARYATRLGFKLGPDGREQVARCVKAWPWPWSQGDPVASAPPALSTRLRMELELLFDEKPWPHALQCLEDWDAFPLLDSGLQTDPRRELRLRRAARLGLPLTAALLLGADAPLEVAERLQLPSQQIRWLGQAQEVLSWLGSDEIRASLPAWTPADWTEALERRGWSAEGVALALVESEQHWRPLLRWWGRWRHLTSPKSANTLIAEGWTPGPELGAELKRCRRQRLENSR